MSGDDQHVGCKGLSRVFFLGGWQQYREVERWSAVMSSENLGKHVVDLVATGGSGSFSIFA